MKKLLTILACLLAGPAFGQTVTLGGITVETCTVPTVTASSAYTAGNSVG